VARCGSRSRRTDFIKLKKVDSFRASKVKRSVLAQQPRNITYQCRCRNMVPLVYRISTGFDCAGPYRTRDVSRPGTTRQMPLPPYQETGPYPFARYHLPLQPGFLRTCGISPIPLIYPRDI